MSPTAIKAPEAPAALGSGIVDGAGMGGSGAVVGAGWVVAGWVVLVVVGEAVVGVVATTVDVTAMVVVVAGDEVVVVVDKAVVAGATVATPVVGSALDPPEQDDNRAPTRTASAIRLTCPFPATPRRRWRRT